MEDIKLLICAKQNGKKWSDIAKTLSGRNENGVKNRFNSLMKKCKK